MKHASLPPWRMSALVAPMKRSTCAVFSSGVGSVDPAIGCSGNCRQHQCRLHAVGLALLAKPSVLVGFHLGRVVAVGIAADCRTDAVSDARRQQFGYVGIALDTLIG